MGREEEGGRGWGEEEGRRRGRERREEDGGEVGGKRMREGRVGWGRGRGGARGRRHPCLSPVPPCPSMSSRLWGHPACEPGRAGRPRVPATRRSPTWILQRRVSCRSRVPCVLLLSTRSARLSSLPPRRSLPQVGLFPRPPPEAWRGDPPTCLLKIPRGPEAGGAAPWRAFPTVPVGVGGCLPA